MAREKMACMAIIKQKMKMETCCIHRDIMMILVL